MVKETQDVIIPYLCFLFNTFLYYNTFPTQFKCATVIPVHKNGDKTSPSNYRPISILPVLSKIFEQIIYRQLLQYFNTNMLISPEQNGFRSEHSTTHTLFKYIDYISTKLNAGYDVISLYLDLSKAFDTVNHHVLLRKLHLLYSFDPFAISFITSYLSDRKIKVKISDSDISSDYIVKHGVPQGSILGPFLFIIYINDVFSKVDNELKVVCYADDTVISYPVNSMHQYNNFQIKINNVLEYYAKNFLIINAKKSFIQIFRRKKNISIHPPTYFYKSMEFEVINNFKYLGVHIDSKLKFNVQYESILSKFKYFNSCFCHLSKIIDASTLTKIYLGFILPYVEYCLETFSTFNLVSLIMLDKINCRLLKYTDLDEYFFSIIYRLKNKYLRLLCNIIENKTTASMRSMLFDSARATYITRRNISLPIANIKLYKFCFSYIIKTLYIKLFDNFNHSSFDRKNIDFMITILPANINDFFRPY